jgi:hypothetical protein
MKNTILYTGLIALSSLGLSSCGKQEVEPTPARVSAAPTVINNTRLYHRTILFDFTVTDDKTIDPAKISLYANGAKLNLTLTKNGDNYTANTLLSSGNHEAYAIVEDADGQITTSDTVTVNVPFAN